MSEKHTPGPWQCIGLSLKTMPPPYMVTAKGCTVAEIIPQPNGIDRANSRLIAAAPALLAALELAEQALNAASETLERAGNAGREDYDVPGACEHTRGFTRSAAIEARSAIAAAKVKP